MASILAVKLLMKKIQAILDDEEVNNAKMRRKISNVMQSLEELQTLLTEPKGKQTVDGDLETIILKKLYSAEDIIDVFLIRRTLQRRKTFAKMYRLTQLMSTDCQTIIQDLEKFIADLREKAKHPLEDKDGEEQSSSKNQSGASDRQSVHAPKPSNSEAKPVVSDEQSAHASEPSNSEAKPGVSDGQFMHAPEPSSLEVKPGVSDEKYARAPEPSRSEAKPGVLDEQYVHAPEPSSSEIKQDVSDEQSAFAPKTSSSEAKPGALDEQSVHAPEPTSTKIEPGLSKEKYGNALETSSLEVEQSLHASERRLPAEQHGHATEPKVAGAVPEILYEKSMQNVRSGEPGAQARGSTKLEEKQTFQNLTSVSGHLDHELDFLGRKDKADELAQVLLGSHKLHFLIAVAGDAGSGKTTFVRNIYIKGNIMQHFALRVWVNVSEEVPETILSNDEAQPNTRNLLIDILKQVTAIKEEEKLSLDKLEEKVHGFFILKRFLIVLDDVKTSDVWKKIKKVFPNSLNGSRVILITRNKNMENELTGQPFLPFMLPNLDIEESWKLFLKQVHKSENSLNDMSLKQQIWDKCKGLPLAIVVLGGLLSTKDQTNWSKVVERLNFGDEPSKAVLALAYEDLSSDLKPCLLYLGLFPKEYMIPVRRLFRLWAAEGLANPSSNGEAPEVLFERYLKELIRRNMVEVATYRIDGSPKTCRVPGILHDNIFPDAIGIGFFHVIRSENYKPPHSVIIRRIATYVDISNSPSDCHIDNLRSYKSFNIRKGDTPAVEVEKVLNKIIGKRGFGLITVLDLEGVYKPVLPEAIGKLLHLSYLGLRWTFLDSIPKSVGDLPNLETLDVKHTNVTALPISIWNSKKLRHLYMNEIYLDVSFQKPLASGSLGNLLTMRGLIIGKKGPGRDWLKRLTGLTKLGLTCHFESLVQMTPWISESTNLRSLKLRSIDEFRRPSELKLGNMDKHNYLEELYLLGKLSIADNLQFPKNLKMLTLSVAQLDKDPMEYLGQLPELNILRLLGRSYVGKEMTCHAKGFQKLRVLKLWMLEELEKWTLEEGTMTCLRELEIRCCENLKEIDGLNKLTMLKELILTNMPSDFVVKTVGIMKEIQGRNVEVAVNNWKFAPLPK